ncbi:MAG TPA: HesA/MoeB/ThiF family protein, partial [Armatimonadetes bacterium]|nr:HesA/MoeB/ThiF family protein [Armatimonadota bacterium]
MKRGGEGMVELTPRDREKYRRQMMIPGFGEETQRRLKNSSALVTRAGGLGGPVALYLAMAGIGRLVVAHGGNVTWSNLNRQILMSHDWVGKPRADKIRESILSMNPDVDLTVIAEDPNDENVDEWVAGVDIVCDCPPTFEERFALNRAIVRHRKPMIEAAMNSMEAHLTVIVPGETPCLACLYPGFPDWWSGTEFPVLGAVSGALGCLAAIE